MAGSGVESWSRLGKGVQNLATNRVHDGLIRMVTRWLRRFVGVGGEFNHVACHDGGGDSGGGYRRRRGLEASLLRFSAVMIVVFVIVSVLTTYVNK